MSFWLQRLNSKRPCNPAVSGHLTDPVCVHIRPLSFLWLVWVAGGLVFCRKGEHVMWPCVSWYGGGSGQSGNGSKAERRILLV